MKTKGISTFKLVAALSVCGFLLGMSGASAATEKQSPAKDPRTPARSAAGPLSEAKTSLPFMTQAYCESDCCWASGDEVSCSNSGCSGSGKGGVAIFICSQT